MTRGTGCLEETLRRLAIAKKHLKPALGHVPLQQVTPLHVERYYADRGLKLAERSVALHKAIITSALNAAVTAGVLRNNVAKRATNKPRVRMIEDALHNAWTADEAHRFLVSVKKAGDAQYAALFALALDSGMRKSELLGLHWKDIEVTSLRVERQLLGMLRTKGTGTLRPDTSLPKGKRARSLDLSDETVVLLREHKRQQAELKLKNRLQYVDHGLIFALNNGMLRRQLDKLCGASGV